METTKKPDISIGSTRLPQPCAKLLRRLVTAELRYRHSQLAALKHVAALLDGDVEHVEDEPDDDPRLGSAENK